MAAFTAGTLGAQRVWFPGQDGSTTETSRCFQKPLAQLWEEKKFGQTSFLEYSNSASEKALLVEGCGK